MMKYNEIIGVNENFQYSVNLQFDINNISKIKEYIPTKDGCELLKLYITSVYKGKNRATTLIGPYGKGKSHLLLVLITLLNDYEKDDIKYINEFIEKTKDIDFEFYEIIKEIRQKEIKLMPVIINSNYGDLNQAFLLALSEALERENLNNIVTNTYFDVAIKVLENWEERYQETVVEFSACLKEWNCSLKKLKLELKNYSEKYYEIFKKVYSCILHGQEFNPLVNSDIVKTYKDLTHEIKQYGYSGIFIVFDEFSKFLEYVDNSHMMRDLKILQDFAELSNRTGSEEQIHISCITHKSMNQYTNNKDEEEVNAFRTVEGRFKELYFNRSLEQNYEIVSYALEKKKGFHEYYLNRFEKNEQFYKSVKRLNIFKDVHDIEKSLFKGCFPLNPITVYSLIGLSEKIAQNERTLFTFLTDDDNNSLKSFINNNGNGLFNINKIYDYFRMLFKKENDLLIRDFWIKAENAMNKTKDDNQIAIIKALAVIYMINETEIFVATDETLRLSLNMNEEEYQKALAELIDKSILKKRKITDELEFTTIYNRGLAKAVKRLTDTQFVNINVRDIMNEVISKRYSLPRRYNEQFKMTRFFLNIFITEEQLLNMNNFDILFEENYCDGIILNLIRESRNIQHIRNHFESLGSNNVVLEIPKTIFPKNIELWLREYKAINELLSDRNLDSEANAELELMLKETTDTLEEQISLYYASDNIQEYLYKNNIVKKVRNISSYISKICSEIYAESPIVNNELINKKELSAPIKKARDIVIDTILSNDKSLIKSPTSAEATIYKAIVDKKETESISKIIGIIDNFTTSSENDKISFEKLYAILEKQPYSIRKGILPILIAMSLYNYSDIIVIYFMNKEIDLDAANLIKINERPDKYYIHTEKGTSDKIKYLSHLMYIFEVPNLDTQRINLKKLVEKMRRWILSLPRILREYNIENSELNIKSEYIKIKNELLRPDINNNEFIYQRMFEIFNTSDYEYVLTEITDMKDTFDNFLNRYFETLIKVTKNIINKTFKGSLTSLLKEWYEKNKLEYSTTIYELKTRNFIEYIKMLTTHDENDVIEKMSKIMTGYYIEDWQPNDYEEFINSIHDILLNVKDNENTSENLSNKITLFDGNEKIEKYLSDATEISAIGHTMKNNIEDLIDEYGESLTEQEKISVLVDIIKKYM